MSNLLPKRVVTAYWLMAFAWLQIPRWAFTVWMVLDDSRTTFADHAGMLLLSAVMTIAYTAAMVVAARWMLSAEQRGHYLAAALIGLAALFSLRMGLNVEIAITGAFLILILNDLRLARSSTGFSPTVESYRLVDFWVVPWLVSALCVALVGRGQGAVVAGLVHLFSPLLLGYVHFRLVRHPSVLREPRAGRYYLSLAAWVLFYMVTLVLGFYLLKGLGGLASQGAGA